MPLTRSPGAVNLVTLDNSSDVEDVGIQEMARGGGMSQIRTRQQTQREAALRLVSGQTPQASSGGNTSDGQHIQQVLERTLDSFRNEISGLVALELRKAMSNINLNRQDTETRYGDDPNSNGANEEPMRVASLHAADGPSPPTDKISSLINNWHVNFKGSLGEVPVEDFIYRVRTLTNLHLGGDFDLLCRHSHILFEGKARQWFWRFHRQMKGSFNWFDLCEALKRQFRDTATDNDIKDDMRRRRQRINENFEEYLEVLMNMNDRLHTPITDQEFVEIVTRNLRNELRYELLHVNIPNIAVLRSEVRKHEKFNEEVKVWPGRGSFGVRKQVSEVDVEVQHELEEDLEVLKATEMRCWNCETVGHRYQECLAPRRIFCYGCGKVDTYKPHCVNCISKLKSLNSKMDVYPMADSHPQKMPRK